METRLTTLMVSFILVGLLAPELTAGERSRFRMPWGKGRAARKVIAAKGENAKIKAPRTVPADAPVIGSRRFSIEYAVRDIFGAGKSLSKVELYLTDDMGVTWRNVGEDEDHKSPYVVSVPKDGAYGFVLVSTDAVGNREREPFPGMVPDKVIVVDGTAPTGKWLSPVKQSIMGEEGITLAWETTDEHPSRRPVTLQYSSNQGKTWRTIQTVEPLPAAGNLVVRPKRQKAVSYTFRMLVGDRAGNQATIQAPGVILTDNLAPTIALTGPKAPGEKGVDLTYTVSDNKGGSGVNAVILWQTEDGGKTWSVYGKDEDLTSPVAYVNKGAGRVGFALQAGDVAGNQSAAPAAGDAPALSFTFDTVGPEITVTVGGGSPHFRGGKNVSVEWATQDASPAANGVTVEFSADGGTTWEILVDKQPAEAGYRWTLPRDNAKNLTKCLVRVTAVDALGNQSIKKSAPFSILSVPPTTKPIKVVPSPVKPEAASVPKKADSIEDVIPILPAPKIKPREFHPSAGVADDNGLEVLGPRAMVLEREKKARLERERIAREKAAAAAEEKARLAKVRAVEAARIAAETEKRRRETEEKEKKLKAIEDELKAKREAAEQRKIEDDAKAKLDAEKEALRAKKEAEDIARLREEARQAQKDLQEKLEKSRELERKRQERLEAEAKARENAAARERELLTEQRRKDEELLKRHQEEERRKRLDAERKAVEAAGPIGKVPDAKPPVIEPRPKSGSTLELVKQGELAFEEGRGKQAELFAMEAIDRDPNEATAHLLLSKVYGSRGTYPEAIASAEKAISLNERNPESYIVMGNLSFEMVKQTQKRLQVLLDVQGDQEDIDRTRETLTRHYRNAIASFRQVTKLDKGSKEAYGRLGDVFYYRGKAAQDDAMRQSAYWDALENFKTASEIGTPTYKETFHLGVIHYRRGEYGPAVRYFQRGIEVCPPDRKPRECLWYISESYERQNRLDDALLFWKKAAQAYDPAKPKELGFHRKAMQNARRLEMKLNN
ncbi:MAG: hypothetical protein ACYTGH_08400 [Planctomycetota bacterium]|jgi:tetratricopeptide (TPR) repeat protein